MTESTYLCRFIIKDEPLHMVLELPLVEPTFKALIKLYGVGYTFLDEQIELEEVPSKVHAPSNPNTQDELFLSLVQDEILKARAKFPEGRKLDAALMEEVGELVQALLHIDEKDGQIDRLQLHDNVFNEAIQVAAMAARIAVEGCPEHNYRSVPQPMPPRHAE